MKDSLEFLKAIFKLYLETRFTIIIPANEIQRSSLIVGQS